MRAPIAIFATALALLVAAPAASGHIFWGELVNGGGVGRANLDGTGVDNAFIAGGPTYSNVRGVAANANHVFFGNNLWSSSGTFLPPRIGRADVSGANAMETFTASTGQALTGVAVDSTHIYWSSVNQDNGGVGRTPIVGGQQYQAIESTFGQPNPRPCGVASDGEYLYWANMGTNSIGRAELAHWGEVGHVEGNWLPLGPEIQPCGVAVDDEFVYWGVHYEISPGNPPARGTTIGRADKDDGAGATNSFLGGGDQVTGLAIHGDFLYWSNYAGGVPGAGSIGRGNVAGGGWNESYVTGIEPPWGVAVDGGGPAALPPQENTPGNYIPPLSVYQPGGSGAPPPPLGRPDFSRVWSNYEVFAPAPWNTPVIGGVVKGSRVHRGTVWNFILKRKAKVTIAIARKDGRRWKKVVTLKRRAVKGRNSVPFSARIRGKAFAPGSYRAVFVAKAGRKRSKPRTLTFRIVKP